MAEYIVNGTNEWDEVAERVHTENELDKTIRALIAAERDAARDAALVEAAAVCEVVHTDRINRGSLRIGAGWFEIRDEILALRTKT
jgi:hypothetical protein